MEYKQIKRIFFNWLKSQDAYEAYKLARHNTNHLVNGHRSGHPYYRYRLVPVQFINHAFTWRLTPEGHDFWDNINCKWRKYLREIETNPKYQ
jgi:hypothetical protein